MDPIKTGRKNVDKIVATLSVAPPINIGEVPSGTETMEFTATTTNKIIQGYKSTNGETNMSSVRYKCPNVQAGVYKLKLELYINAAKWGTTEQTIIVDPGNTSHKTIEIPYKLDEKPPKPTDLQVKYARPDNDEDTTQEYTATFTWKDNSFNAEGFELLITDATGTSVDPQPSITYDTTGKPRATVKLKLATEYKAKIKAKNATFGDSDFTDFLDTNTGDIIHLARIKYDLGESGQVVDVPDDENPLCVKSTGTTGATSAHNLAVGYYTKLITGTNVQLPRDIGFPSVYRIANNFVYTIKGWYGTNINSSGTPGSITIGSATASVKELPEGITDSISLTAVWEQHTPTGISFPQNKELCYIVDGNSWIDAKKDTAKPITVKIIPKTGYSIKTPAGDITGTCSTDTAATIETGAITKAGGVITVPCNVIFKASGYHCVNFFITLTDDSGHKTYVSALAYFDVK